MSIYDFKIKQMDNKEISLKDFSNKILLIVNTASKCGFTPQLEQLEQLYKKYRDKGLIILAFPCNQFGEQEPGTDKEIKTFCSMNYGVSFNILSKIDVNGDKALPLFKYLVLEKPFEGFDIEHPLAKKLDEILSAEDNKYKQNNNIKWNFTKFIVDKQGKVVRRFEPTADISKIEECIKSLL